MSRATWDVVTSMCVSVTGILAAVFLVAYSLRRELSPLERARPELWSGAVLTVLFLLNAVLRFAVLGA